MIGHGTVPRPLRGPVAAARAVGGGVGAVGDQVLFVGRATASVPRAALRYQREVLRLLAEVSLGTGPLAVVGGTVGIIVFLTFSTGAVVGLAGYEGLNAVGTEAYTGFISAYFNTREVAPLVAAVALSATVGSGFTAQLGAMRIGEEIDAVEAMGIPSVVYLVATRIVAAFVAVVPLYVIALLGSYTATRLVAVDYYHQSGGTYDHYFYAFLPAHDVLLSFAKVLVFAVIVVAFHCYYGFHATGGPEGVGQAVGRSVRLVIVLVVIGDFLLSLVLFGVSSVTIAG